MTWRRALTSLAVLAGLALAPNAALSKDTLVNQRGQMIAATECLARNASALSAHVLAEEPYSKAQWAAAKELIAGRWSCLGQKNAVAVRGDIFYGELASAMLERKPELLAQVAALPVSAPQRPGTGLKDGPFVGAFAECLAHAEPAKTVAILKTVRDSAEERAAVIAYGQALSDCTATDIAYHMNIPDLRAHLAYSVYRMATAAGVQGA